MDFIETDGGIVVPKPEKPAAEKAQELPVLLGWSFSKCGERYYQSDDVEFRKRALEDLYTAIDPGGGGIRGQDRITRLTSLVDQLAVELVGGIPEGCEAYT